MGFFASGKRAPCMYKCRKRKYAFEGWNIIVHTRLRNYRYTPPMNTAPPPRLSSVGAKILATYVEWHVILTRHVPKGLRYSLGIKIDSLFAELVAGVSRAQFSPESERPMRLSEAIGINDTLKFMLYALFELKGIDERKFIALSEKTEEAA